ncbi:putative set domain protein, partial [Fasciolopsis buskii]
MTESFELGDLFWAKVGSHPWWPCMIYYTPDGEILQLLSSVPLTLEEEAESIAAYLREEIEVRSEKNPDIDQKLLENELRAQWPSFDIPTKRSYLQDKLGIFNTTPQ